MGRALPLALAMVLLCGRAPCANPPVYTLHIESQPLDTALQDFARQTGMQVLFYSPLTDGRRSSALDGKFTLDAAITALLLNSNLTYRTVNPKTIEIVPVRAGTPAGDRR